MDLLDTRTHCKHGHPFDTANNYRNKKGRFVCRVCNRLRMHRVTNTIEGKQKNRQRVALWQAANRLRFNTYCQARRATTRAWILATKAKGCFNCEESHPACIDFHHRNPTTKKFDIGAAVGNGIALKRIQVEVDKCDLICSNCHRKLHASERL